MARCAVLLVAVLAAVAASSASASRSLVFTVKTKQGPTVAHPHPPAGGVGDSYESSLALANAGIPQLGRPARATVGTMQFTYTIRKPVHVVLAEVRRNGRLHDGDDASRRRR